jgi:peptidoglycan/LPS O-acetylase OafA/YrhL
MSSSPGYIPNLTPLRGIAALWVLFFHYQVVVVRVLGGGLEGIFEKAYLWVDFFFILSGFVIFHVYGQKFHGGISKLSYRRFLIARFARVYPLHFFITMFMVIPQVIMLFAAPEQAFSGWNSVDKLIGNLLLVHSIGLFDSLSWNVPSWSISAEWLTYLVAPFLFLLFHKKRSLLWGILYLATLVGLHFLPELAPEKDNLDLTYELGFVRCLLSFTGGVVLYQLYQYGWGKDFFKRDIVFLMGILWVLAYFIWEGDQEGGVDVVVLPAFALLTICAAHNQSILQKIFATKGLQLLGDISYSLYLAQGITIGLAIGIFVMPTGQEPPLEGADPIWGWIGLLGFTLVTFLISLLTYYKIEVPFRSKVKKWLKY